MNRHMVRLFLILGFCSTSFITNAFPSDREQVMYVTADSADLNQQKHRGIYKGHVQLKQGTTEVHAAEALTQANEKNQLIYAIAKGSPQAQAHYQTLTNKEKPLFHAYADEIHFDPVKHLITLTGQARVVQGNDSFSAAKIIYDTMKQHVVSESDGQTRTTIIIHPKKKAL